MQPLASRVDTTFWFLPNNKYNLFRTLNYEMHFQLNKTIVLIKTLDILIIAPVVNTAVRLIAYHMSINTIIMEKVPI